MPATAVVCRLDGVMRMVIAAGLCLVMVCGHAVAEEWIGSEETPAKADNAVRLASYNVLNLFDDVDDPALEGRQDDCFSYDKTVRAKPREQCVAAAAIMREIDADIVGLQEIESYDALIKFREEHLEGMGYEHVASIDVGQERGIEQAVISRFPIKEVRVWPHRELGGVHPAMYGDRENWYAGEPLLWRRSPIMATIEVPAGARGNDEAYELTVFVVHHKSGRYNDYWREAEAKALNAIIAEMKADDPERNIAVLGDFNAKLGDESVEMYFSTGFQDVFPTEGDRERNELVTHESGRRIDFVFVNEAMAREVVPGSAFVASTPVRPEGADWRSTDPPAGYASDHLPVVVDLVPVDK